MGELARLLLIPSASPPAAPWLAMDIGVPLRRVGGVGRPFGWLQTSAGSL
jgi:hypothetical protein